MKTNVPALIQRLDRRSFLQVSSAFGLAGMAARPALGIANTKSFANDPFSLGVASGDPSSDGFVLWTRLAPDPLNGGGMKPEPVKVRWEVAADDAMQKVVQQGEATATADWGIPFTSKSPGWNRIVRIGIGSLRQMRRALWVAL